MNKPITFQVVKGTNVRRNAETGLEIHRDCDGFTFFSRQRDGSLAYWGEEYSLREALAEGREKVQMIRDHIDMDHEDALEMEQERTLAHITEVAAANDLPRRARELAEGIYIKAINFRKGGEYGKAIGYLNAAVVSIDKSAEAYAFMAGTR
jgi:hypothetical protein